LIACILYKPDGCLKNKTVSKSVLFDIFPFICLTDGFCTRTEIFHIEKHVKVMDFMERDNLTGKIYKTDM